MSDAFKRLVIMVQQAAPLAAGGGPITREILAQQIRLVSGLSPAFAGLDLDAVLKELESRMNVWVGQEAALSAQDDHVAWLTPERKQGWRWWGRYREWLEQSWAERSVEALDSTTDKILGLLEDPARAGSWDRRGLVVGHVQSGKTASYTGLVNKAADAGYKVIVVLAGVHSNLRSQTQMRLDEGFLGYESATPKELKARPFKRIGVGLIDASAELRADSITNRAENGDFSSAVAKQFAVNLGGRPMLFVVKKNASVLKNLLGYVRWAASGAVGEGQREIVRGVPLLVIDDEADHASVDTRQQEKGEDGRPQPDHDPTAINKAIRQLLLAFEKRAYVGYTATPFANIFIHDQASTPTEGDDLFPRSFIVNLPAPSNYAGPARIFGLRRDASEGEVPALGLVRTVTDHADSLELDERSGWMPPLHKKEHTPLYNGADELPPSLRQALLAFLLACAARRARGQVGVFNSMLIHVTRFTDVQALVHRQVEGEVLRLRRRLRLGDGSSTLPLKEELRALWEGDFVPTAHRVSGQVQDPQLTSVTWDQIELHLRTVAEGILVRTINGSARDALDYDQHRATGLDVVAIGGDKLARGLTLEGLTVSYFLRATRMYDTLMQMGRWFGYRPGYLDLCRLYTTSDLSRWFEHITEAAEELREEFDRMVAIGGTPRDYGLKVQSHPVLLVTSQVKMRNSQELSLSFAGNVSETVVFFRDAERVRSNLRAAEMLLARIGRPSRTHTELRLPGGGRTTWPNLPVWSEVPAEAVRAFLLSTSTPEEANKVRGPLLAEYIQKMNALSELSTWTVAILSGKGAEAQIGGHTTRLIRRESRLGKDQASAPLYTIRRLLSPRDEAIDLSEEQIARALTLTRERFHADAERAADKEPPDFPSGLSLREVRDPGRGLLLLYPLSPVDPEGEEGARQLVHSDLPVMAFGVSFPGSKHAAFVTYRVTNLYWQQEYGGGS